MASLSSTSTIILQKKRKSFILEILVSRISDFCVDGVQILKKQHSKIVGTYNCKSFSIVVSVLSITLDDVGNRYEVWNMMRAGRRELVSKVILFISDLDFGRKI